MRPSMLKSVDAARGCLDPVRRRAGWRGVGAGLGLALFAGLAIAGVLPASIIVVGVPTFALLGYIAAYDMFK